MTKPSTTRALIVGALALVLATGVVARDDDDDDGEKKAPSKHAAAAPSGVPIASGKMLVDTCAGCHGTNGNSMGPSTPNISAMAPEVFVETMQNYQSGEMYSTIMGRIAKGYSDEELEAMGEYLHGLAYMPARQKYDEALVEEGAGLHEKYCEKCHAEGGKPLPDEDDYNILAGQWTPFLVNTMADFTAKRTEMPKKMASKVKAMLEAKPDGAFEALWAYYASQQSTNAE